MTSDFEPMRLELSVVAATGVYEPKISSLALAAALDALEAAFQDSARRQLRWLRKDISSSLKDWPQGALVLIDAAQERLATTRQSSFVITEARAGSVVLTGFVGALAIYVLKQTIGEAFEEAWKHSGVRSKLVAWFRDRLDDIAADADRSIRRALHRTQRRDVTAGHGVRVHPGVHGISVKVVCHEAPLSSYGEALRTDEGVDE